MIKKTTTVFVFWILFACPLLHAQITDINCNELYLAKVNAPSGLVLREQPSRTSSKIIAIPHGEEVSVCENYQLENVFEILNDTLEGYWQRVFYQEKQGFVFDAYLDKNPTIEVFSPNHADMPIWLPKPVYAINAKSTVRYEQLFSVQKLHVVSKTSQSGEVYDALLEDYDNALVVFGGIQIKSPEIWGFSNSYYGQENLFPGYTRQFGKDKKGFIIYVTGEVLPAKEQGKDDLGFTSILTINNYSVYIKSTATDDAKPQLLLFEKKVLCKEDGFVDMGASLDFAGDLDGDEIPDLVFTQGFGKGRYWLLFLSSKSNKVNLLKLVRKAIRAGC